MFVFIIFFINKDLNDLYFFYKGKEVIYKISDKILNKKNKNIIDLFKKEK